MKLHIAKDLALPLDAITQSLCILARKRAGKSYTARRFAEELIRARQQVVIIDPKGDYWGIRSSADGKRPGLPIIILGGEHGDLPLEANAGEIVAKLAVHEGASLLLDLSLFRKHEVATFMGGSIKGPRISGFLEDFYRLKAHEKYRTPVMLIVDEADAIAPQKPYPGEERMLGAMEDIVRRGGQRGIGCLTVTQRSAVLNKNVLTQTQILVAMRMIAPQDLAAILLWVDVHGTPAERKILMESLPSLPTGDAWFWSPGWPDADGIFKRVHILPIETFDSGATPKPGEKRVDPRNLADIDLEVVRRQMADVVERAKADDPRELRKQIAERDRNIAELKRQVAKPANPIKQAAPDPSALERAEKRGYQRAVAESRKAWSPLKRAVGHAIESMGKAIPAELEWDGGTLDKTIPNVAPALQASPVKQLQYREPIRQAESNGDLTGPERRILDAIAWMESLGIESPKQVAVAFLANYTYGAGSFNNPRGSLRVKGYVEYVPGNQIRLTDEGRKLATYPESALTAEELQSRVLGCLPGPEQKLLKVILAAYPDQISKADCAAASGYAAGAGSFNNPCGRLRTLGLIEYPQTGYVKAMPLLFLQ